MIPVANRLKITVPVLQKVSKPINIKNTHPLFSGGYFDLFAQAVGDIDGLGCVVAFEHCGGVGGDGLLRKKADHRNYYEAADHRDNAGIERILEHEREECAAGNIEPAERDAELNDFKTDAEDERADDRRL